MKIALAALGFKNKDINYNKNKIINSIIEYKDKVDLILFGESFLQGFDALAWEYDNDINVALSQDSAVINEISTICKQYKTGVSFGYIEKFEGKLFSSQITFGESGEIVNNYRRVSTGWKEEAACEKYCEGKDFLPFTYKGKKILVGICGDLWYEENCCKLKDIGSDVILWPVYTDYKQEEWKDKAKFEYAIQAAKAGEKILYVNSVCLDEESDQVAKGGAAFFENGNIKMEISLGQEGVLVVEV